MARHTLDRFVRTFGLTATAFAGCLAGFIYSGAVLAHTSLPRPTMPSDPATILVGLIVASAIPAIGLSHFARSVAGSMAARASAIAAIAYAGYSGNAMALMGMSGNLASAAFFGVLGIVPALLLGVVLARLGEEGSVASSPGRSTVSGAYADAV